MRLLAAFCALIGCTSPESVTTAHHHIFAPTNQTQGSLSFTCPSGDPVTVTGASGPLTAGDVIAGADVRGIVLDNGMAQVTYEILDQYGASPPVRELGSHMLWRRTGSGQPYARALSTAYGDWTYIAAPFSTGAVEAHVLTATDDVAEVAFVFDHHLDYTGTQDSFGFTPVWWGGPGACTPANGCGCFLAGCGVAERDFGGDGIRVAPYCDEPTCLRWIRHVTFVKTVRLERCAEGYFVGYHSDPPLNPKNGAAGNHENSYGERELGTGGWNAVTWSSAGNIFRHPGQAQHGYLGIDDPTYLPSYPGQYQGFPAEQATGPWWVADIPYFNRADEMPFVRYVVLEHRLETGVWSFGAQQLGSTVVHFMNAETEADGQPTRYQAFVGAMPHIAQEQACAITGLSGLWRCFPSEPLASTTAAIEARLPLSWP